jgi:hypothetical protein
LCGEPHKVRTNCSKSLLGNRLRAPGPGRVMRVRL